MFDWSDFMSTAEELAQRDGDQAASRTAIGRCYYAAFGTARRQLLESGTPLPPGGLAHRAVWDRLHLSPDSVAKRAADRGRRLLGRRNQADYDNVATVSGIDARDAVLLAQGILQDLARLRS